MWDEWWRRNFWCTSFRERKRILQKNSGKVKYARRLPAKRKGDENRREEKIKPSGRKETASNPNLQFGKFGQGRNSNLFLGGTFKRTRRRRHTLFSRWCKFRKKIQLPLSLSRVYRSKSRQCDPPARPPSPNCLGKKNSFHVPTRFYLRRSRQVIERWELLLLLLLLLLGEDYFEVMTLELTLNPWSTFFVKVNFNFPPPSCFPTQNFLRGGIRPDRSRFVSHRVLPP